MLALLPPPDDFEDAETFGGILILRRRYEVAGRAFHQFFEKKNHHTVGSNEERQDTSNFKPCVNTNEQDESHKKQKKQLCTNDRLKLYLKGPNLYKVLSLNESSTTDVIRKAYRKYVLEYHPDKLGQRKLLDVPSSSDSSIFNGLTSEEAFSLIQDAYEILSDPTLRQLYDSSLPFDASIPSNVTINSEMIQKSPQIFFDVFEPVFTRNSKWSVVQPVPFLGTLNTAYNETLDFYNFWWKFQSSRTRMHEEEYNLSEADCRDERRWMERQNQKLRKKFLQEEQTRINTLTNFAYSLDPRVKAEEAKKKEIQLAKKKEEDEKRIKLQLEKEKLENERLLQLKCEEQKKLELKQKVRSTLKKYRQRFRELLECQATDNRNFDDDDCNISTHIFHYVASSTPEEIETELSRLTTLSTVPSRLDVFYETVNKKKTSVTSNSPQEKLLKDSSSKAVPSSNTDTKQHKHALEQQVVNWSTQDLSLLAKAIQKYPGGTPKRWQLITQMVGNNKTIEDVIKKTKQLTDKQLNIGVTNTAANLPSAIASSSSAVSTLEVAAADKQCQGSVATTKKQSSRPSENENPTGLVWTEKQQQKLEQAMKKFSPSMSPKDRWVKISTEVPGKSAKECWKRYQLIREALLSSTGNTNVQKNNVQKKIEL